MSDSPRSLVTYTFPGCGHSARITRRNADKQPDLCWPCRSAVEAPARAAAALDRKRAAARDSYHRTKQRGPLTAEQRTLQRRLVGFTRYVPTEVTQCWICWPRPPEANVPEPSAPAWYARGSSAIEVAGWLHELGIPCAVLILDKRHRVLLAVEVTADVIADPAAFSDSVFRGRRAAAAGLAPAVPIHALDDLTRWLPTLGAKIRAALDEQHEHQSATTPGEPDES